MRYSSRREAVLWAAAIIQVLAIIVAVGLSIASGIGCSQDKQDLSAVPTSQPTTVIASQDKAQVKATVWTTISTVAKMFTRDVTISGGTYIGPVGGWVVAGVLAAVLYHRTARWHGKRKTRRKMRQSCPICGHKL
jgi:hypothetical protein